jgi:hypothetical protein
VRYTYISFASASASASRMFSGILYIKAAGTSARQSSRDRQLNWRAQTYYEWYENVSEITDESCRSGNMEFLIHTEKKSCFGKVGVQKCTCRSTGNYGDGGKCTFVGDPAEK